MKNPNYKTTLNADDARRAYHKKWREKNKDKIKAYNVKYWEKQAEKANKEAKSSENAHN